MNDGFIHIVYESLGIIWYEKVTTTGSVLCKPITFNQSKNPSIEVCGNSLAVVYQEAGQPPTSDGAATSGQGAI